MNTIAERQQSACNELVLLLDDEPVLLDALEVSIEMAGIKCVKASSIAEASSILKSKGDNVFLVFLDWRLMEDGRVRTGADFLTICRKDHPLMPVIVMTGLGKDVWDVEGDALLSEADGFLAKPLRAVVVQGYVKRWLQRRRAMPKVFIPVTAADVRPLEDIERAYVRSVVKVCNNNNSLAAEKLGITRQTVGKLLNQE
jgi:DNA-binding NtrC family response regulator